MRKMGLEPTRCNHHKILSLARLPVPTLPPATNIIIPPSDFSVNKNFGSREIFVDNLLLFTAREPPIVTIRGDIESFAAGKSPRI